MQTSDELQLALKALGFKSIPTSLTIEDAAELIEKVGLAKALLELHACRLGNVD